MLKYLRIAVTALSLTVCVLLIVLWVRSFMVAHLVLRAPPASPTVWLVSARGWFTIATAPVHPGELWEVGRAPSSNNSQIGQWTSYGPFPYPIGVLLFAACAALPWAYRFGLRTLLIAMALGAVGMGIVVAAR